MTLIQTLLWNTKERKEGGKKRGEKRRRSNIASTESRPGRP